MSGVTCHHSPWNANTMNDVGHGMPSTPFNSTHGRTTSGLTCHHRLWTSHTVEQRRAWHAITALGVADTVRRRRALYAIIALGWQTLSNDVGRGIPSPPLDSTHGRTMSGIGKHRQSDDVRRGLPSPPWDSTHGRTTSGVACHHLPWTTHTVG